MELLLSILMLTPVNNWVMSLIKFLSVGSASKLWLRCILFALSVGGMIAMSALTGNAIDFNEVSELAKLLFGSTLLSLTSHVSFRLNREI